MGLTSRPLPDADAPLRDCIDFISGSGLCRQALSAPEPPALANLVRDFLEQIFRLQQSCHLPEFTDHGLSHLCSLVDRLSGWTLTPDGPTERPLVSQLTPTEAGVLLLATLFHDIGMLSQRVDDLPVRERLITQPRLDDIANWVRHTHVKRLEGLVARLLEVTGHSVFLNHECIQRAMRVGAAHQSWPEAWQGQDVTGRDAGLAALLAVSDLLDEDSERCDTHTLLAHRQGNSLNYAHWLRHSLSVTRATVQRGVVSVRFGKLVGTNETLLPVYAALRNHFRIVLLYAEPLRHVSVELKSPEFVPATGFPAEAAAGGDSWRSIPGFATQTALLFHLLRSFFSEALLDTRRLEPERIRQLEAIGLEPVDLSLLHTVPGSIEGRSEYEQGFHALLLADTSTP